jgi:hypothetical protein
VSRSNLKTFSQFVEGECLGGCKGLIYTILLRLPKMRGRSVLEIAHFRVKFTNDDTGGGRRERGVLGGGFRRRRMKGLF